MSIYSFCKKLSEKENQMTLVAIAAFMLGLLISCEVFLPKNVIPWYYELPDELPTRLGPISDWVVIGFATIGALIGYAVVFGLFIFSFVCAIFAVGLVVVIICGFYQDMKSVGWRIWRKRPDVKDPSL